MDDEIPASERPTETMIRPPPPNCPNAGACQEPTVRTDTYAKDQKKLLMWLGGVLALACLSWGTWVTLQVFALQTQAAVSQSEARAIQAQLSRIEAQLTEIQRDLRSQAHGVRP